MFKSKITNPKTGRKIQVGTGLSYGKGHPAYPPAKSAFTDSGYSEDEVDKSDAQINDWHQRHQDKKLEVYCDNHPDSLECRVYDE